MGSQGSRDAQTHSWTDAPETPLTTRIFSGEGIKCLRIKTILFNCTNVTLQSVIDVSHWCSRPIH